MALSGILSEIARVTDKRTAAKVANAVGGTSVWFPGRITIQRGGGRWLVDAVGYETALRIATELGVSAKIWVPMPNRDMETKVRACLQLGMSTRESALRLGCTTRTIENWRRIIRQVDAAAEKRRAKPTPLRNAEAPVQRQGRSTTEALSARGATSFAPKIKED